MVARQLPNIFRKPRPSTSVEQPPNLSTSRTEDTAARADQHQRQQETRGAGPSPQQRAATASKKASSMMPILDDNIQPPAPNTTGPYNILCDICNLVKGRYPCNFFQHLAATHYSASLRSNLVPLLPFYLPFYHCPNCSFKHIDIYRVIVHVGVVHKKIKQLLGSKVVGRYIPESEIAPGRPADICAEREPDQQQLAGVEGRGLMTGGMGDQPLPVSEQGGGQAEASLESRPPPSLQSEPSTSSGLRQQRVMGIKKSITWRSLGSTTVTRKEGKIIVAGPDQAAAKRVASQLASGQAKLGSMGGKQVLIIVSDAVDTASISRRFFCNAPAKSCSKK